jgi:hypothetical protein
MSPHSSALTFPQPPRSIPLSTRLSNLFNAASQIALAWTLFSTPFFWLFGAQADLSGITFLMATATNGTVTETVETSASEGDASIYKVYYRYSVLGEDFQGVSHITGGAPSAGSTVTVLYNETVPSRSKIEGMRRNMFGPGALMVLIFPAVGLIGLWFTVKWGVARNRLLAHGLLADGTLEKSEPTGTTVNDQPMMALTFSYTATDGRKHHAVIKTLDTRFLSDDETEQILYDPDNPDEALGLDDLDPFPDFDEGGRMRGDVKRAAIRSILPAVTILLNLVLAQKIWFS